MDQLKQFIKESYLEFSDLVNKIKPYSGIIKNIMSGNVSIDNMNDDIIDLIRWDVAEISGGKIVLTPVGKEASMMLRYS